jgi:hypothetical protein
MHEKKLKTILKVYFLKTNKSQWIKYFKQNKIKLIISSYICFYFYLS